jgi:hypothetical protein
MTTYRQQLPDSIQSDVDRGSWLDFACIILVLAGCLNVVDGVVAVSGSSYISDHVLFGSVDAWGWAAIALGVGQILAGVAAMRGARWAVAWALVIAFTSVLEQLGSSRTSPVWSLTIIAVDVLAIYGFTTSGVLRRRT